MVFQDVPERAIFREVFPMDSTKKDCKFQKDMLPSVDWPGLNVGASVVAMRGD